MLKLKGKLHLQLIRNGSVILDFDINNLVTNEGKNDILEVAFNGGAQHSSWYFGIIDSAGFSANVVGDTMASHAGWAEWTNYDEATRQEWGTGAASGQSITNAAPATFTINAAGTLHGAFITSSSVKGDATGVLWSTILFSAAIPVVDNDELKLTYTVPYP